MSSLRMSVNLKGDKKLKIMTKKIRKAMDRAQNKDIEDGIKYISALLIGYVQRNKLTGQVLKRGTGELAKGMHYKKVNAGKRKIEYIVSPDKFYGAVQENGAVIRAKYKKFLFIPLSKRAQKSGWNDTLEYGKDYVLAKKVVLKKRPWLIPGAKEFHNTMMSRYLQFLEKRIKV